MSKAEPGKTPNPGERPVAGDMGAWPLGIDTGAVHYAGQVVPASYMQPAEPSSPSSSSSDAPPTTPCVQLTVRTSGGGSATPRPATRQPGRVVARVVKSRKPVVPVGPNESQVIDPPSARSGDDNETRQRDNDVRRRPPQRRRSPPAIRRRLRRSRLRRRPRPSPRTRPFRRRRRWPTRRSRPHRRCRPPPPSATSPPAIRRPGRS